MSFDETLSRSSTIQEMSWKAERTMSIVLAKHLIGVTQHASTIIVRVVGAHFLLEISAELRTQSYSALIFCWKFPLALAGEKKRSRATTIFPANFLAFFFSETPIFPFVLVSRSTGLTQSSACRAEA